MPFIKVENNQVIEQVNEISNDTAEQWRELIIIRPTIDLNKQKYGSYSYDLTKTPAEMIYSVIDLTEEERRRKLLMTNKGIHKRMIEDEILKEFGFNGNKECENCDLSHITNCINNYRNKKQQIESCKTHEDLDAITI